jgi:dihydropyrimidine dehydrogenase (NAD+) subunit PreA
MAVDLSVEFCGIRFPNPFIMASTPAARPQNWDKAARMGWGGGSLWGVSYAGFGRALMRGMPPREAQHIGKPPAFWGYQNVCSVPGIAEAGLIVPELVDKAVRQAKESGLPVVANILGGFDTDIWVNASVAAERAGADLLEINVSCPYIPKIGLHVARDVDKVTEIVRAVNERTEVPLMVKLSACHVTHELQGIARAVVAAGADAISTTNTILSVAGVDIETGMPIPAQMDVGGRMRGMVTGLSGPAIKPMGLRAVSEMVQAVDVPVMGIGGITDWQSAVEYMMLGARVVQVGTAVLLHGHRIVRDMVRGLEEFMERKGYSRVEDFIGITSRGYAVGESYTSASERQPRTMIVDELRCTGCGTCMPACVASANGAIQVTDGVAVINQGLCVQCNSCMLVCPSNAVSTVWQPASTIPTQAAAAPQTAETLVARGHESFTAGRLDEAEGHFSAAIAVDPNLAIAYRNRGSIFHNNGDHEAAVGDYSRAVALNQQDSDSFYFRGMAHQALGRLGEAVVDFTQAIRFNPGQWGAYYARALTYMAQGQRGPALSDVDTVLASAAEPQLHQWAQQIRDQLGAESGAALTTGG